MTAYHEGGHALVGLYCPAASPIHKVTIIPRGNALGMVQRLPETDEYSQNREQMESSIAVYMAGRVAEEIIFGRNKVTSGASSDIKGATNIARAMVTKAPLSDLIGPIFHGSSGDDMYGRQPNNETSEATAELIDAEVKRIITQGYEFAKDILTKHIDQLHTLANALIEYETLSGQQIKNLLSGRALDSEEENKFPFNDSSTIKIDKEKSPEKTKTTKAKKENSAS